MKNSATTLFVILLAVSCGRGGASVQEQQLTFKGDSITVSANSPVTDHIRTLELSRTPFSSEFRTVGTARAENGKYAEVIIPFDGRITRSYVSLGQRVRAGQPLFEMYSPDFNGLVKEYFQAQRTAEKAQAEYNRKKVLLEHGIASRKELDELFTGQEVALRDLESASSTLGIYNVNLEEVKVGQPVVITSPIGGEIVRNNITAGQYVKSDDDSPVTVADLGRMWVTALVKEHYIGSVSSGSKAEILVESAADTKLEARIVNIGNIVDEESRAVQVVLECDNSRHILKHGMYVSVHFISEPAESIVVPTSSIFQGEQSNYVFTATDDPRVFVRRSVRTGSSNDDNTLICITEGLEPGDRVITEGGIYLAE